MAHPTKNFTITIRYPETMTIRHKPFVLHNKMCIPLEAPGYLRLTYDSWMLPMRGMAWEFDKRSMND